MNKEKEIDMNYYIQGDAAKADKIKAAFKKKGIDVLDFGFADKTVVYCSIGGCGGCVQSLPYSINLMHILYSHSDYQVLPLQAQPKFKVGDKVIYKGKVSTITFMDEVYYDFDGGVAGCRIEFQDDLLRAASKFNGEVWIVSTRNQTLTYRILESNIINELGKLAYKVEIYSDGIYEKTCLIPSDKMDEWGHLWTVQDAKDGDVLANTAGCILIAKDNESCSCYIDKNGGFHADNNKWFFVNFSDNALTPATQEQRDLLFTKMREAGYQWDADKKELRKIQPHYDIANFHAGMPVLVRDYDNSRWSYVQFSHYVGECRMKFNACGIPYIQCIPYNNDTKHLLGTTDPCDERFINW